VLDSYVDFSALARTSLEMLAEQPGIAYNAGYLGTRTTWNQGGNFLIAPRLERQQAQRHH
jgi:hypothetical protein